MSEHKDRRRNCADRMRADLMTRRIHRRRKLDPAMSVAVAMLGLVAGLIRLFPPLPERSLIELPVAPRIVPVPASGPVPRPVRYKRTPSWARLMADLSRPIARAEAVDEIRSRLPLSVRPWIDEIVRLEDWSALRACAPPKSQDEAVVLAVERWALEWQAELDERARSAKRTRRGGEGEASSGATPGASSDDDENPEGGMKR